MAEDKKEVLLRYPVFDISFFTEDEEWTITYDSKKNLEGTALKKTDITNDFMAESVISLSTKNAMEDDSAVFSFLLAGDVYWDRVLTANDAVVLKITPNEEGKQPDNTVLLVGLISEVRLEGDYGENSKMYRITGQSFAKAFMQFELGVIQEVSVVLTDIGWLPDDVGQDGGVKMSGSTARDLAESMVERFLDYMKYDFNGKKIKDFLTWDLDSWTKDEKLIDNTPFINYEGSLKQLLDDITAKPFNELFFDATPEGKCQMIMRRTPFDEKDWYALPAYYATSADVISESVAVNDTEAYSIFNISLDNALGIESMDLGSFPQFFEPLISKYGYRKLEVANRYLQGALIADDSEDTETTTTSTGGTEETSGNVGTGGRSLDDIYNLVTNVFKSYTRNQVRVLKSKITSSLMGIDKRITSTKANTLIDQYLKNELTKERFSTVTGITASNASGANGSSTPSYTAVRSFMNNNRTAEPSELTEKLLGRFNMSENEATSLAQTYIANGNKIDKTQYDDIMQVPDSENATTAGTSSKSLKEFTKRLANWYCENPNFYSGDITVKGDPKYRLGGRLFVQDAQNDELWEYYIESVQHDYSYSAGFTTTLGVTRGLQNGGNDRFKNYWDKSKDFKGGYLGEMSLEELLKQQEEKNNTQQADTGEDSSGGSDGVVISGGTIAEKACDWGRKHSKTESSFRSAYDWGGGRSGKDPFLSSPIATDCSSFVWWCFKHAGIELKGGATGMTTWTIDADTRLKSVSTYGQKSKQVLSRMRVGDIVWFDTAGSNTHMGIYCGGNKFVACNGSGSMNESATAGIIVGDITSDYWWSAFRGNVKRLP